MCFSAKTKSRLVRPPNQSLRRNKRGDRGTARFRPHESQVSVSSPPNDPPFGQESHPNLGGNWDASWRWNGDLRPMFLVAQPLEEVATVPITVIINWPALLKKGADTP